MSMKSNITLLNLSKQLPFDLDDKRKKDICFGEALILSCGHYEGDVDDGSSESEWTCRDSTSSKSSDDVKEEKEYEVPPCIVEESKSEEEEEENDFHFFFFPDCKKPLPPKHSDDSILMVDGLPKINSATKVKIICSCAKSKDGKCECFIKLPCDCGANSLEDCTCHEATEVCACKPLEPAPVCTCETNKEVCTCYPETILPECTCNKVEKPCICIKPQFTFPSPVCTCKRKPKLPGPKTISPSSATSYRYGEEGNYSERTVKPESEEGPCECQKPDPKGDGDLDERSICSCDLPKVCTCENTTSQCKCFPTKSCACINPEKCRCFYTCDCQAPCLCDTIPTETKACTCLDPLKVPVTDLVCTCPKQEDNKLRRVRAGKHGYRWCHEVDPKHTFFDFAYDRHEKIEKKESEPEKFTIQGLKDTEVHEDNVCPVHMVKAPKYEKKIRKPSLDCCSAVGGISISVEPLGEDKDKFLVQVVSHSSKEGAKTGSKLVSILDCNLHTMEENRTEYIIKKNLMKERRSYMAICANGYYNKVTNVCGDKDVVKRVYHTFEKAHDFLLEGANVVLMRYFGLSRYRGNVKTDTVLMNGVICQSIYVSHGVSQAIVNGSSMFVVKVERHIIEPSGQVHQTLTVVTLRGYIVSHEWADNCYVMHVNPLLQIVPEKDQIEQHAPLRATWRNDLQLLSDYLDFKTIRTSEGGRYLTESGTLTGAVRDYLQAILLLRPQDTLHFTRHYFRSVLSALDLPHDEYFDPTSRHVRYYFFEE